MIQWMMNRFLSLSLYRLQTKSASAKLRDWMDLGALNFQSPDESHKNPTPENWSKDCAAKYAGIGSCRYALLDRNGPGF